MATNTIKGKAFEYAVLRSLERKLAGEDVEVNIVKSPAFETAKSSFEVLDDNAKRDYKLAADCGIDMIRPLEPRLGNSNSILKLQIQTDAQGQEGDVRDVICIRDAEGWEIGFSCKHNHEALKHPRVTEGMDFGSDWVGIPCSAEFKQRIASALKPVEKWADSGDLWRQHSDIVQDTVYMPILNAFVDEISRLCELDASVPGKLLGYFFGVEDFYKIIAKDRRRDGAPGTTKVMAFNINGELGQSDSGVKPLHPVKHIKMPSKLFDIRVKEGTKTTILITFDESWVVSMRLHNADSKVRRTGLKWDVQLKGMPSDMYQQEQPWYV